MGIKRIVGLLRSVVKKEDQTKECKD
jgi:hypothetical protein